ncbi:hypothetical protein DFH07DRAFT_968126 [Mycena maculata]|uniref:Uncharacterized protein n=1 Tax=Mycena maculata TaxID=230809 RepID=A0AAD7I3J0_9AGAR|nr:hypothetical protein DFH07DRAFT_968126 [Mycena maculata]
MRASFLPGAYMHLSFSRPYARVHSPQRPLLVSSLPSHKGVYLSTTTPNAPPLSLPPSPLLSVAASAPVSAEAYAFDLKSFYKLINMEVFSTCFDTPARMAQLPPSSPHLLVATAPPPRSSPSGDAYCTPTFSLTSLPSFASGRARRSPLPFPQAATMLTKTRTESRDNIVCLGFLWDVAERCVSLPEEKHLKHLAHVRRMLIGMWRKVHSPSLTPHLQEIRGSICHLSSLPLGPRNDLVRSFAFVSYVPASIPTTIGAVPPASRPALHPLLLLHSSALAPSCHIGRYALPPSPLSLVLSSTLGACVLLRPLVRARRHRAHCRPQRRIRPPDSEPLSLTAPMPLQLPAPTPFVLGHISLSSWAPVPLASLADVRKASAFNFVDAPSCGLSAPRILDCDHLAWRFELPAELDGVRPCRPRKNLVSAPLLIPASIPVNSNALSLPHISPFPPPCLSGLLPSLRPFERPPLQPPSSSAAP